MLKRRNTSRVTKKQFSTQPVLPDHNRQRAGNPGSLGLFSFAVTAMIEGVFDVAWPAKSESTIAGLAITYGGITQFIAGLLEIRMGNSFSGTTFGSFGAIWVAKGLTHFSTSDLYRI